MDIGKASLQQTACAQVVAGRNEWSESPWRRRPVVGNPGESNGRMKCNPLSLWPATADGPHPNILQKLDAPGRAFEIWDSMNSNALKK
jgi:hypothetical protein